jgi:hypothetical protein
MLRSRWNSLAGVNVKQDNLLCEATSATTQNEYIECALACYVVCRVPYNAIVRSNIITVPALYSTVLSILYPTLQREPVDQLVVGYTSDCSASRRIRISCVSGAKVLEVLVKGMKISPYSDYQYRRCTLLCSLSCIPLL